MSASVVLFYDAEIPVCNTINAIEEMYITVFLVEMQRSSFL